MHRRHRSLTTAALVASSLLAAPSAGAQLLQQTSSTTPTSVIVNIGGKSTWIAKELKWPSGAPGVATPRIAVRSAPEAQRRIAIKPSSTTVELVSPTSTTDAALAQWVNGPGAKVPSDVTLTIVNASGTPLAKYLLHEALPTKVSIGQLDAGASQIQLTHLTLTAESVEVVPVGH